MTYPPTIASVRAIKPRVSFTRSKNNERVGLYHLPFLALLVYFFRECYETSGKPYRIAMEHHKSQGYEPTEFVDGKLVTKKGSGGGFGGGDDGMMMKQKFEVKDEWATEDDGFGGFEEEEEKGEEEDGREAGSTFLSYLGFNEKQTDDSVFQERLKPRYQAAGSRDSCGLFSLGRGWQELYAARQGCGGSSRGGGGGAFEDEEDEEDENTRNNNNTNTTKKKTTTKSSYFFSPKTSTKKARERFSQTPRKREEGKHEDGSSSSVF